MEEKRIDINGSNDVITARQIGREMIRQLGFGSADQTRLATAISELARNIIQYSVGGECVFAEIARENTIGLRVTFLDRGPGIPDITQAMESGFSTGNGLGAGLSGARRLVSNFDIESNTSCTKITIEMIRKKIGQFIKKEANLHL